MTGASGLLGRQVVEALVRDGWHIRGLCHSRRSLRPSGATAAGFELVACDLAEEGEASRQVEDFQPYAVLHLAGEWRPNVLRRQLGRSRRLNVDATGSIAAACQRSGVWLIFVSSDGVFDGRAAPYAVDAVANPLSEYGWHKLHGEQLTLVACPRAAVLRVALLYGPCDGTSDSAVTSLHADLASGVLEVDAWQRCYPTWTPDVAGVLAAMLRLHVDGRGQALRGVFHWQGGEQLSWHEMLLQVAEIAGIDASGITPVTAPPAAPLPRDCRLDCSRLETLLGGEVVAELRTPFRQGLRQCLAPLVAATASPRSACRALREGQAGAPDRGNAVDLARKVHHEVAAERPAEGASPWPVDSRRPVASQSMTAVPLRGGARDEEAVAARGVSHARGSGRAGSESGASSGPLDPEGQFREELKKRGAALQELFWQELERTRNRLKEAGLAEGRRTGWAGDGTGVGSARQTSGNMAALDSITDGIGANLLPKRRMLKVDGVCSAESRAFDSAQANEAAHGTAAAARVTVAEPQRGHCDAPVAVGSAEDENRPPDKQSELDRKLSDSSPTLLLEPDRRC